MLENGHQLRSRIARRLDADQYTGGKGPIRSHLIEASGSSKLGMYLLAFSLAAAVSAERRILARRGWAGEKVDFLNIRLLNNIELDA
jgi:hypothetical protein